MPALDKMQQALKEYKDAHTSALNEIQTLQARADEVKSQADSIEALESEIAELDRRYAHLQGELEDLAQEFSHSLFWQSDKGASCLERRDEIQEELSQLQTRRGELQKQLDDIDTLDGEHARELYDEAHNVEGPDLGALKEAEKEAEGERHKAREAVRKAAYAANNVDYEGFNAKERRAAQRRREAQEEKRREKEEAKQRRRQQQVEELQARPDARVRIGGDPNNPADYVKK
jgi:DNA repair exonuclease SbcCD ATPase subunit